MTTIFVSIFVVGAFVVALRLITGIKLMSTIALVWLGLVTSFAMPIVIEYDARNSCSRDAIASGVNVNVDMLVACHGVKY